MILVSDGLAFTTFWILFAIGLYILVGVFGGALFAPSLRRQTELVASDGSGSAAYEAAGRRTRVTGLLTMLPDRRDPLPDGDEAHPVGRLAPVALLGRQALPDESEPDAPRG